MAKTVPITSTKKLKALQQKHRRIDYFAHDNPDRELTFQFAKRQGLSGDEIAKAMYRNFNIKGTFLNPNDFTHHTEE